MNSGCHDFQKVMNVNQQRVQSSIWDVQAKTGLVNQGGSAQPPMSNIVMNESAGERMNSGSGAAGASPAALRQSQSTSPTQPASISAQLQPGTTQMRGSPQQPQQ